MISLLRKKTLSAALFLTLLGRLASAASWTQTADIQGSDFFDNFDWFSEKDPTNGLVTYQTEDAAKAANLSYVNSDGQFVMAVSTIPTALEGRPSVRLQSKQAFNDGVYVLNVSHVPIGCSSWPAWWTLTEDIDNWPIGGEIDIMENANDEYPSNLVSAHTSSDCVIDMTEANAYGEITYNNCSAYTPANSGCRSEMSGGPAPTWGPQLNKAGGGVFAMERSFGTEGQGVRVWYFPNSDSSSLPRDLRASSKSVDTSGWGKPYAQLPISSCYSDFGAHKIIFDITLCGDWAANTYEQSACAATYKACSSQVAYNGSSYNETFWSVNSLRVFSNGGGAANAANSPQTGRKSSTSASSSKQESQSASAPSFGTAGSLGALFGAAGLMTGLQLLF